MLEPEKLTLISFFCILLAHGRVASEPSTSQEKNVAFKTKCDGICGCGWCSFSDGFFVR